MGAGALPDLPGHARLDVRRTSILRGLEVRLGERDLELRARHAQPFDTDTQQRQSDRQLEFGLANRRAFERRGLQGRSTEIDVRDDAGRVDFQHRVEVEARKVSP